ncbi:MAG: class I SAM-dependent methyltransferase [Spirosomataceae bacterium]
MTWEETIKYIQHHPSYTSLVRNTYIDSNLAANVERFRTGAEFKETHSLLNEYVQLPPIKLLDIGAGNGIAGIAFALLGYEVTSVEPDESNTIGRGAIQTIAEEYQLNNLTIVNGFGEKLPFENETFDVVYIRQALHHAQDLPLFVKEASRVLKKQGIMLTLRDHVIKSEQDKKKFLARHPLHRYYGGENAFRLSEYQGAFAKAGLEVLKQLSPSSSVINYDPWSKTQLKQYITAKMGAWAGSQPWLLSFAWYLSLIRKEHIPGKLYSFVLRKK